MKCALCGKEADLMQSHIIPKLVYKRIRSHTCSRFRALDNITRVMQDGEKRPMLCQECEELFSSYETKFSSQYLDDYLTTNRIQHKPSRVVKNYFLTVAWRILWDDLYRLNSYNDCIIRPVFEDFCTDLRDYLLSIGKNNDRSSSLKFRTYVFKIDSLIKNKAIIELSKGCLFGYSFYHAKNNSIAVIAYYAGLVFVTYYDYDKEKYVFIGQGPVIFKAVTRRKEIIEEMKRQFSEMALQYKEAMTPELQQSIQDYYKKHS